MATLTDRSLLESLADRLARARHVAVLTGAGISAESGIPTFRDAMTGYWALYRPEELASPRAFANDPAIVWAWYHMRRDLVRRARPNAGHLALAELGRRAPRLSLITQNVDGLHARAGSTEVIELHGSLLRARCTADGRVLPRWDYRDEVPHCECGATLRPDVVWFGELLPPGPLALAQQAAATCDVFLSVGTSGLVEPAATLPLLAAERGAEVIVVNTACEGQPRGPRIHHLEGAAGELLPRLVRAAWPATSVA